MARMPTLFISHGSPMLAVADSAARRFLAQLGPKLPPPTAVVVISAHYDMPTTEVTAAERPETIHDFGGFPDELYRLRYPAPGHPQLARDIVALLTAGDIRARTCPCCKSRSAVGARRKSISLWGARCARCAIRARSSWDRGAPRTTSRYMRTRAAATTRA